MVVDFFYLECFYWNFLNNILMEKIYKNKMISKNKHYSIIEKNNKIFTLYIDIKC